MKKSWKGRTRGGREGWGERRMRSQRPQQEGVAVWGLEGCRLREGGGAAGGKPRGLLRPVGGASRPACGPASGPCEGAGLSAPSSGWGSSLHQEHRALCLSPAPPSPGKPFHPLAFEHSRCWMARGCRGRGARLEFRGLTWALLRAGPLLGSRISVP